MASTTDDADVVQTLRVFVSTTRPVLAALREPDLFGLSSSEPPGIRGRLRDKAVNGIAAARASSASTTVQDRADWWVRRVGLVTSMLAAAPAIGGPVTEKLPLKDALAAAGQGIVLCGIASEYGVQETDEQVQLLAVVLLHREVDPAHFSPDTEQIQAEAAESTDELREADSRPTITAMARTLWKLGRTLSSLSHEFSSHRQSSTRRSRLMGKLPVAGTLISFQTERSALEDVARAASAWLGTRGQIV